MNKLLYILFVAMCFTACEKQIDYTLDGNLPEKPNFSIEQVVDNPNKFLVTDLSPSNFTRVWNFGKGIPATSTLVQDTVFFTKKGDYTITLHISAADGNGNAFASKTVSVLEDVAGCQYPFLPEECTLKCWKLSGEPGGVKVGPAPLSGEWYTSPNIVDTQADDEWCFDGDGNFFYNNNGSSFSSCQGFIEVVDYPIPADMLFEFKQGGGFDGLDEISIPTEIYMGVEDSGPTYNIINVNETSMVLLTPVKPCDGSPSPGWFTLTFYSN